VLIVEVKREHDRAHPVDGEAGRKALAVRRWEGLSPERLKYVILFTDTETIPADSLGEIRRFVRGESAVSAGTAGSDRGAS
jgi:hypothetical protein